MLWRTEVVTHRKIYEDAPWRFHLSRKISSGGYAYSSNVCFLGDSADQTHGLVVERSGGRGDQDIDTILIKFFDKFGCRFVKYFASIVDAPHESAPQSLGHLANFAGVF